MQGFTPERIETVVIGGGQTGLSVGHHLARRGLPFVILDASERIGDAWRNRWDSLRLFTPAKYCSLDGMPFPADPGYFPTKDEMGDYLESYAERFDLPVRLGTRVDRVSRRGDRFMVAAGDQLWEAENVVLAMANYQVGKVPSFASDLDPDICQMHSMAYRRPSQLADGDVLVVGAANSGVEIAVDVADGREVWLSGRYPGQIPFDVENPIAQRFLVPLVLRVLFHRVLQVTNPIGRRARPKILSKGRELVRTRAKDIEAAGIENVPRVVGVEDGMPLLADGRTLDVANVIWCTGFESGFDWLDIDVMDGDQPRHRSGIVEEVPGLYAVGLEFLHAASSEQIHGVGRDAERVVEAIQRRTARRREEAA